MDDETEGPSPVFKLGPFRKRRASPECPSAHKLYLSKRVSDWKRHHLEYLHIYYAKDFAETPFDILQRIQTLTGLDEEQQNYIEDLKSYLKFNFSVRKLKFQSSVVQSAISRLHETSAREPDAVITMKDAFVTTQVQRFVIALNRLLLDVQDNFKNLKTYEEVYSRFACAFADLCCLEAIQRSKGEKTTWENFRGITIISEPDCHFFKLGLSKERTNTPVSVVEVKNNIKSNYKHKHEREHPKRKRYKSSTSDTSGSSSSDTSSASYEVYPRRTLRKEEEEKARAPLIEDIINKRVLGQHGGELLLDLNKFYGDKEADILTIPGMIVDETTVIFTLLEMSQKHLEKLRNNVELDTYDEATIYYSKPYDILCEESRDILIENFMILNNMDM